MRDVSRDIQWLFKGVQREFSGGFTDYGNFKGMERKCRVCFQKISMKSFSRGDNLNIVRVASFIITKINF